jgi:hypothetical protein
LRRFLETFVPKLNKSLCKLVYHALPIQENGPIGTMVHAVAPVAEQPLGFAWRN